MTKAKENVLDAKEKKKKKGSMLYRKPVQSEKETFT